MFWWINKNLVCSNEEDFYLNRVLRKATLGMGRYEILTVW